MSSGHRGLKLLCIQQVFTPSISLGPHPLTCGLSSTSSTSSFYSSNSLQSPFFVFTSSAMAQIRGTAGYNLGHQNPFGGPGSADATNDPSPLDAIREQTSKIEDWLDTMADPVKPYV